MRDEMLDALRHAVLALDEGTHRTRAQAGTRVARRARRALFAASAPIPEVIAERFGECERESKRVPQSVLGVHEQAHR